VKLETLRASSSRPQRQRNLVDGFETTIKFNLNALWANFFYAANIPFVVARNPVFKEVVKRTSECNGPCTPPSYHNLRHKLLDAVKTDIKTKLHNKTKDNIRKLGATLSIDGWSSVINRPLINAIFVSSASEQFLGSVDTIGVKKNADFLAFILEKCIEQVGFTNVMQVTANNALVNPVA
jgi:hypothetical protein